MHMWPSFVSKYNKSNHKRKNSKPIPSLGLEVTGYPVLLWDTGRVDSRVETSRIFWGVLLKVTKNKDHEDDMRVYDRVTSMCYSLMQLVVC